MSAKSDTSKIAHLLKVMHLSKNENIDKETKKKLYDSSPYDKEKVIGNSKDAGKDQIE